MHTRKLIVVLAALASALSLPAVTVDFYLDAAPNVYGSPAYNLWWATAKADASAGTFVDMAHSFNPANAGTTWFDIRDEVVYSFGDLGKRLHFIYWVPNETLTTLAGKNFQIAMDYIWDGATYDFYNDYYGQTWQTPTKWENYTSSAGVSGVIGTAGFAWWGAYGINTPAALEADINSWFSYQGDITLKVKADDMAGPASFTAHYNRVPDQSATLLLVSAALCLLFGWRRHCA